METFRSAVELALEKGSPIFSMTLSVFLFSCGWRFIWNFLRGDFLGGACSSASDVEESVDMPFNDFEPDEEQEETEEDLSLKWTCDYCGSVHRNTDCVCDACGGRRLRW